MIGQGRRPTVSILVVDDSPTNLGVLVDALESIDLNVAIAQDGEEALQRAAFLAPDLILLDVMMPGIDGLETCRRLKAEPATAAIPVIFMTALSGTDHLTAAFAAGAVDYITKPFHLDEVLARVNTRLSLVATHRALLERHLLLEHEIAARRRADAALEVSERLFRGLFEGAPNAMVTVDGHGRIEMVNTQTEEMFGYSRAELLGRPVEILLPTGPRLRAGEVTSGRSRLVSPERILLLSRKDGSRVEVEIWLNPIATDPGVTLLASIVDISDRVRLEAQLRQSQKMEAIGRITAGAAHDFNNLLQSLGGSLEMLLDGGANSQEADQWLGVALRAVSRGRELTDRLLAFSRQQMLSARAVPVGKLLADVKHLISHFFESPDDARTHLLVLPCSPELAVFADAGQLEAALINLVVNARDAMPSGGSLRISARAADADPAIVAPGRYCVISVVDTGCGMDAATLAQACEPFFSTKGPGGSGLGLSMVQGFARQSKGEAHIVSVVGEGTTVDLWLPAAGEPLAPETRAATPSPQRGRILMVDDNEDMLLIIKSFMKRAGFTVTTARSGEQALAQMQAGASFDAIVTDFAMAGMNGVEFLLQARRIVPSMPALMITGFVGPDIMRRLPDVGMLRKPFSSTDLVEAVGKLIRVSAAGEMPP
jgi:PAS domain S-box-containing protein